MAHLKRLIRKQQLRIVRLKERKRIQVIGKRRDAAIAEYNETPATAIVLQFFNKLRNIQMLYTGMLASGADELLVLEDGSSDDSLHAWANLLTQPNHFLIHSNDLYEVRTYDRALRYTSASIVALVQDDDELPHTTDWLDRARELFALDPCLAVLGGRDGIDVLPLELTTMTSNVTLVPGRMRYRTFRHSGSEAISYCMTVNRGPMVVRADAIRALGGINQAYAPFQCDDVDLCLRAWKAGWRVGLYSPGFIRRNVGEGGMRLYNDQRTRVQSARNWPRIYEAHGPEIYGSYLRDRIANLNGEPAS